MKRFLVGVVICSLFVLVLGLIGKWESQFAINGTVKTAICGKCCLVDDLGESWIVYDKDLKQGEAVKITFDSKHSTTHSDDEIIKYSVQK